MVVLDSANCCKNQCGELVVNFYIHNVEVNLTFEWNLVKYWSGAYL